MKFIELTGASLRDLLHDHEMDPRQLQTAGVGPTTIVRVNQQGDIEVRRTDGWDVIGGLLGDFDERLKQQTGLDWA